MATEADILAPICETRGERGGNLADQATDMPITKHQYQADAQNGLLTVEGENFLTPPLIVEMHSEGNNGAPNAGKVNEKSDQIVKYATDVLLLSPILDDRPLEINENEETSSRGIQQNEESKGSNKEETQESKTTSILKGEELHVQVKATEEDIMCKLTRDVAEGECDQNRISSEQEGFGNAKSSEDNLEAESFGSEKHTSTEDPVEGNNTKSSAEDQSPNGNLHGNTEEKPTDAVETHKEKEEQCGNLVERTTNISIPNLPNEEQCQDDTHNGLTTVEVDNFLRPPSVDEVHCEGNNNAPDVIQVTEKPNQTVDDDTNTLLLRPKLDDQPLATDSNEETFSGGIQQNAEEANGSDQEGTKESKTMSVLEGEELNVQVETTDKKTEDEKTTEEDIWCKDLSKGECNQNETSSEQEGFGNARISADNLEAELFESGESTSTLLKEDVQIEKSVKSEHVAPETSEASNLVQETSLKCPQEDQSTNAYLHEGDTKEKTIDAVETEEEIHENFSSAATEDVEENSLIELDGSETKDEEHLGKESEKTSLSLPLATEASDKDESIILHEARIEDEERRKIEHCEHEKSTESMLLKMESQIEKTEDSENIKAPDSDQEIETRSCVEERSVATHPLVILDKQTNDETIDAAEVTEETFENVPTIVPYEKMEENSAIQFDGPIVETEDQLKKDTEQPSLMEDSRGNIVKDEVKTEVENPCREELFEDKKAESALLKEEVQTEMHVESLHAALDDIKASDLGQHTERPSIFDGETRRDSTLLKEEELQDAPEDLKASASSEDIETTCSLKEESLLMRNDTNDVTVEKEVTLEVQNVATDMEHKEHQEKDSEISSLTDAPTEETNANTAEDSSEPKNGGEDSMKTELENIENTSVKEEAPVEKPIDSLQAAPEDINALDSSQDADSFIEEKITPTYPQEISSDKLEKECIDAADTNEENLEDIDDKDNSPIKEDSSENASLKEATIRKSNDEELPVVHEAKLVGENEKNTECTNLVKEDVSSEAAAQDVKASAFGEDKETSSVEEQKLTTNPQGIIDDTTKDDQTDDATGSEEAIPEDKQDIAKTTPYEDIEKNMPLQVDCSRTDQHEASENDSKQTSLKEALIGDSTEGNVDKEEAQVENPIDALRVGTEDLELSSSCQETSSVKEKILTADHQEISCDRTEEKAIDGSYTKKENLEDVAINVPNAYDEDNSPIEVDSSEKPSLGESSSGNTSNDKSTIMQESKFADENIVKADLFENKKNKGFALVKEEVSVKSLEVENEDISSQYGETSHLEEGGLKQDETINATELKEGTPEDKLQNFATEIPHEHTEEKSVTQVVCSQTEHEEHLDFENSHLTEASAEENNTDESIDIDQLKNKGAELENTKSTSVKEEVEVEKLIDSLKSFPEDIKEPNSCEEGILTAYPQEISNDKTEEESIDAAKRSEESLEGIATNILDIDKDDNLPIEEDGSQKPSLDEATAGNNDEEESIVTPEAELVGETTKNIECILVEEEESIESSDVGAQDIKTSALSQDKETSSLEEQSLTKDPQEILDDTKEDKTFDATGAEEDTPEDKVQQNIAKTTSYEEMGENMAVQVDLFGLEQNEVLESVGEKTSLTEAPTGHHSDESIIMQEAKYEDESIVKADLLQNEKNMECDLVNKDVEASDLEGRGLLTNPQGIMGDTKEDKTFDATDLEEETLENKSYETSFEDTEESSSILEDCSHSEKDVENTSTTRVPTADTLASTLVNEKAKVEEVLTVDPEDISRDKTIEKTQDNAKDVPQGDNEDKSPQKPSLEEASTDDANESATTQEAELVEESLTKADLSENELVKEYVSIESSKVAAEDIKAYSSGEDRETVSEEEQILNPNPGGLVSEDKTIDPFDMHKEAPKDEVPKEMENINIEATNIELEEEEGYLKDSQMETVVNIAAHEEKGSNSIAVEIPCSKDLNVYEDVAGHLAEEHTKTSNENVTNVTSLASEASVQNNDHKVVEEANICGDKTDTEKIGVLDDGVVTIPTKETIAESDPRGSTEAEVRVPDEEKEPALVQKDTQTVNEGASQVVSELEGLSGEEDRTTSDNCKEVLGSSSSVASGEDSTSNYFQESERETRMEAANAEAQEQEEVHVSTLVQESSIEELKKDVQSCVAGANDSEIIQEMQELEEPPLPAPYENITDTTECKENARKTKEGDDGTKNTTEREQEETESNQEEESFDEKVETTEFVSVAVANDFIPISPKETSKVDHPISEREVTQDGKEMHTEKTASDDNEERNINSNRSITDLESKIDDEDLEIKDTIPTATEGQDIERTSTGETITLLSECGRDGYEHANVGGLSEEKSHSNEVKFEPGEQKSEYESNNQVLESVAQVQSYDIISEIEERKTEAENLEVAAEIKSEKVGAENIFEQEETTDEKEIMKDNILSEKVQLARNMQTKEEHADVEDHHQVSCKEKVITDSHLQDEEKQEEEVNTAKISENETENEPKVSEKTDDKGLNKQEENFLTNDKTLQEKEEAKKFEEVTTILDTEEAHGLDIAYVKTGTEDSNKEINSCTVACPEDKDNTTRAEDTANETVSDQNSNVPEMDAAARELPKGLDENIVSEAPPTNTVHKTIEDSEAKKETHTIMMLQREEDSTSKHDILPLPQLDELHAKVEEKMMLSARTSKEENIADSWSTPNEDEVTKTSQTSIFKSSEEEYPDNSRASQTSIFSAEIEQSSEATRVATQVEEPKAVIDPRSAIPSATALESQQVEEIYDECKVMAELPREINFTDYEDKMVEKDDPASLQNVRDIIEDVQGLNKGSVEVSNKENPVEAEADADEDREISEGQQTRKTSKDVSEGVNCEELETINDKSEESERQTDSLSMLPDAKCSDLETTEKGPQVHLDVTEPEATLLPLKDKHVALGADQTMNLNPGNPNGNENISAECSRGEHEILEPSKVEQEGADCGNEERADQETREKSESKETNKPSLSDLLQVFKGETLQMEKHPTTEKESTTHREDLKAEKTDETAHEDTKIDDEEELNEQKGSELSSEAPVIVDMGDADVKVSHKKSHNILSGVGSKVKHSIAKVKKVITGKSSHPKPTSPKKVITCEK